MSRAEAMAAVQARRKQEAVTMVQVQAWLRMSEADLERIALAAAGRGLSIQGLLEHFVTDAVCGTHADLKASYAARKYLEEAFPDRYNSYPYSLNFVRYLFDHGQLPEVLSDPDLEADDVREWKWFALWNNYQGACTYEHVPSEAWGQARRHLTNAFETVQSIK